MARKPFSLASGPALKPGRSFFARQALCRAADDWLVVVGEGPDDQRTISTGVPIPVFEKTVEATLEGMRTQPCEAG